MAYVRKTRDVWHIQGWYCAEHGWETECTEDTRAEALQRLKEYRANSSYGYRLRKGREKLED